MAILTSDGSVANVQALHNSAANGDTIKIPAGTFTWATTLNISKSIRLLGVQNNSTILNNVASGPLIGWGTSSGISEIAFLVFQEGPAQSSKSDQHFLGVYTGSGTQPLLCHDNAFFSNGHMLSQVLWSVNGGVIWNNTFDSNWSTDENIQLKFPPGTDTYPTLHTMGAEGDPTGLKNTYIEDNIFQRTMFETLDTDDCSRSVIRHNKFDNTSVVSHGYDTSPHGARHWEIYNNTFIFTTGSNPNPPAGSPPINIVGWTLMRGGTGVIYNNVMPNIQSTAWGDKQEIQFGIFSLTQIRCFTQYPVPRQVGQGWTGGAGSYSYSEAPSLGSGYITEPIYIWGNTGGGNYDNPSWFDNTDTCGHGLTSQSFVRANRDFFTGTVRPGYTGYTYPHPLRSQATGGGGGTGGQIVQGTVGIAGIGGVKSTSGGRVMKGAKVTLI